MKEGFKEVSEDEFSAWLESYPKEKLAVDFNRIYEPPIVAFYDWSISDPNKGGNLDKALMGFYTRPWEKEKPPYNHHIRTQSGEAPTQRWLSC